MKNFTVYSKDGCPYCQQITEVLNLSGLNYVEYKLDEHFDYKSFYEQFGYGATFPQVLINGQKMGGCTETVKYLRENNLL